MRKRLTAALLCLCLLFTLLPATAFAEGEPDSGPQPAAQSALCEHHPSNDESCGYTEGTAGSPCTHQHDEDCYILVTECVHEHGPECYPEESVSENTATPSEPEEAEPSECTHECSEESGCMTKILDCKHEHKVNGGEADREGGLGRDEACGYVPATEGTPCTFVCEVCNAQDSGNPATPSDAQPEECTCETLCTGEEINADCPVCSAEGAELDKVCVGAAPMLPVTALAAAPNTVYVGGVALTGSSDSIVYATTNENGEVITEGATADNYNIKWDGSTLTLHDATIQKELNDSSLFISGSVIGVINQNGNAELTIQLEGSNTIEETNQGLSMGIYVYSSGGGVALNIKGNGTLVLNSNYQTIQVISSNGNAALSIENAKVTATSSYSNVVTVQSGNSENSSASLTVDGGSLTATAPSNNVSGIRFVFGSSTSGSGTPTVTVSDNATVRANGSAGGITNNSSTGVQYGTGGKETGGIIWNGTEGTVYGNVTLQEDLEIGEGESLTLDDGANLSAGDHNVIVDGGTLDESLKESLGDSVKYAPTITNHPKNVEVKENETATFTVEATGTEPLSYQWQQSTDNGKNWTNIASANAAEYTTGKTTMDMNGYQYRCVVTGYGTAAESDAATLTVQKATTPIEPKYVRYIVEHYKQNADGSYTLADTEQPIDEIDKTVTATPKTYEGYTYNPNAAGTVVSGTLKAISSPDDIVTLKLYYDITLYTVTVNGSYAQTTGAGGYAKDATVTIDAGTRSGYTFDGWTSADGVTFANAGSTQTTFTMPDKAVTVTANWKKNSGGGGGGGSSYDYYTISATAGEGGSISPSGNISVRESRDKTFTITPYSGYVISDVRVDGVSIGAVASYTFDNVRRSHTIEATFAKGNPATGNPFTDVHPDDWFYNDVMFVYQNGLMTGTSATTFEPNTSTTRAMIVAMLARLENVTDADSAGFTDVADGDWYATAVNWAASEGIVGGFGDGTFQPNAAITREQMAAILMNYAEYKGQDVSARADLSGYTDAADVSAWAEDSMTWAVAEGLLKGVTADTLEPQGAATRAQVAAILQRFLSE